MAKKIIKYTLLALLFLAIAIIVFRVIIASDESPLSDMIVTENAAASYKALDDSVKPYFIKTHDVPYQISEVDGYFSAYSFIWIPSARQVQVVVRYNKAVKSKLGMAEEEPFVFLLAVDGTDQLITPTCSEKTDKWMYHYERLVYDNIDVTDENDLWIEMRTETSETWINRLVCHYALQKSKTKFYDLSKAEIRSLEQ